MSSLGRHWPAVPMIGQAWCILNREEGATLTLPINLLTQDIHIWTKRVAIHFVIILFCIIFQLSVLYYILHSFLSVWLFLLISVVYNFFHGPNRRTKVRHWFMTFSTDYFGKKTLRSQTFYINKVLRNVWTVPVITILSISVRHRLPGVYRDLLQYIRGFQLKL